MPTDMRTQSRLDRIDAAVAAYHDAYMRAVFQDRLDDARIHVAQVDRLLDLRNRVQRGEPFTAAEIPLRPHRQKGAHHAPTHTG